MELKDFLTWATTAGAAWLTYHLINSVPALAGLGPRAKRRVAYALSGGIAVLAYLIMVEFGYVAAPAGDWHAWAETLFAVATSAFGLATIIHGERDLPVEPMGEF